MSKNRMQKKAKAGTKKVQATCATMSNEQRQFLPLPRFPALIWQLEACWLLGLAEHQGKILVSMEAFF